MNNINEKIKKITTELKSLQFKKEPYQMTFDEYAEYLFYGDNDYWNEYGLQKSNLSYKNDLAKVQRGLLSPTKIIGKGGSKKNALKWLKEQIDYLELRIKTKNKSYFHTITNYHSILKEAKKEGRFVDDILWQNAKNMFENEVKKIHLSREKK